MDDSQGVPVKISCIDYNDDGQQTAIYLSIRQDALEKLDLSETMGLDIVLAKDGRSIVCWRVDPKSSWARMLVRKGTRFVVFKKNLISYKFNATEVRAVRGPDGRVSIPLPEPGTVQYRKRTKSAHAAPAPTPAQVAPLEQPVPFVDGRQSSIGALIDEGMVLVERLNALIAKSNGALNVTSNDSSDGRFKLTFRQL